MNDNGSIVLGWLTKLVILFAVLGFLAFDGFTLVKANYDASDDASTAASAAADSYRATRNVQTAYNAAVAAVAGKGDTIETKTFSIAADGTVTLTVDQAPTTLWMHYVGPLKSWTQVHQTGTGAPAS